MKRLNSQNDFWQLNNFLMVDLRLLSQFLVKAFKSCLHIFQNDNFLFVNDLPDWIKDLSDIFVGKFESFNELSLRMIYYKLIKVYVISFLNFSLFYWEFLIVRIFINSYKWFYFFNEKACSFEYLLIEVRFIASVLKVLMRIWKNLFI